MNLFAFALLSLPAPPPVLPEDLDRFPDQRTAVGALEFHRAFRRHVEAHQALDPRRWWEYQAALSTIDAARAPWAELHDAHEHAAYPMLLVEHLTKLRGRIGVDAYMTGRMPPPVPLWLFEEVGR